MVHRTFEGAIVGGGLFRCTPKTSPSLGANYFHAVPLPGLHTESTTLQRKAIDSFNFNKGRGHQRETFFKSQIGLFPKPAETNQSRTSSHLPQTSRAVPQKHAAFTVSVAARALPGDGVEGRVAHADQAPCAPVIPVKQQASRYVCGAGPLACHASALFANYRPIAQAI